MMRELQELTYILKKSKTRSIEIIGDETRQYSSKLYQLFHAIQNKEVTTDKEAAKLIYGEAKISSKYRNLKHELKKKMLNTILFIDTNGEKDREDNYYQCWKDWAACRILIEKSARNTAINLAEKILKRALKYNFHDLIISIAILLRAHYALVKKDKAKFKYYNGLYDNSKRQEKYKNLAHQYYMQLILDHTSEGVTANPKIKEDAERYYQELKEFNANTDGIKFYYYLYQIKLLGLMGVFDYTAAKQVCDEAIEFLKDKNFEGGLRNFLLNKLVCTIQLKEFEEGRATAVQCQKIVSEDSFNWFKTNEYLIMLSLHTGNYQEGYEIFYSVIRHPRYKSFSSLHETWELYKMYFHFLLLINKIKPKLNDKSFSSLKLGKFINNIPSFSKDKTGMNVPVLIIQMAILVQKRDYDKVVERVEPLNRYCDRYLKQNSPNFRSNCFIKMLTQIPKANFNSIGTKRKAEKYIKKMEATKINFANQAHEVEIIPFEKMWELILTTL